MQQISKHVKAMSGDEYADIKREERKKHKELRDKKKAAQVAMEPMNNP